MPLLAVDWDRREARYILASVSGDRLTIHAAAAVPLVDVVEGGHAPHPDVGNSLRAALADQKVGRPTTLVGVDRSSVELLQCTLPPAHDSELPEMVANQAMRESPQVTEQSILDFVPLDEVASAPRRVLAVALSPDRLGQINETCSVAGLRPSRLLFRPLAAASLLVRATAPPEQVCLVVNRLADEVDLTVLVEGRPALLRTVRLPTATTEDKLTQRLLGEINRTAVVALQNESNGGGIERVYILGSPAKRRWLADRIRDELLLPVTVVDPFESADIPEDLVPAESGRFASLMGMLLDEVQAGAHAIDFLHPRKKPQPPNYRRLATAAGLLVAAVLAAAGYFVYDQIATLDADIAGLTLRKKELDQSLKKAADQQKVVAAFEQWRAGDVTWLDELRDLSQRFPPSRDAIVLRMNLAPARGTGGSIDMQCLVRDPTIVVRMEQAIRDQFHQIRSKRVQQRGKEKAYTWQFETSMYAARRDKQQYLGKPDEEEKAPAKAVAGAKPPRPAGAKAAGEVKR
ncbi:MAG: hypothetical protein GXY83_30530 [Rhodopirellula sp.]|nr:hypothetical protein [Rhodopirellula sp.]